MPGNFATTTYPFNTSRSIPANASLGIFSASDYSTTYGTGGDDTAAVQAAINAAQTAGGGVAFLPPPSSGSVNVSVGSGIGAQSLLLPPGIWLVGASPGVKVKVLPGSSVDWIVATGNHTSIDYRTVQAVNTRSQTLGGNNYTTFNPASPVALASGGGIANISFVGESSPASGLGIGVMLNAASGFFLMNTAFSNCSGESVSLWDCQNVTILNCQGTVTTAFIGVHRACYDTTIIDSEASGATVSSYRVYTEQFQVVNGPLLTLTPEFTRFVGAHHYSSTVVNAGIDLGGPAYVNMTACTADNTTLVAPFQSETRFASVPFQILSDTTAGAVASVTGTAPIVITGTQAAPNVTLTTPLTVANGGTGTATPALVAGSGITVTGSWPDQTITNAAQGSTTLAGLTDVSISSPANNQELTYNSTAAKWENVTPPNALYQGLITIPKLASFTWANQGAATAVDTAVGIAMTAPHGSGTNNIRFLYASAPTTPWTRHFLLSPGILLDNSTICGVGFSDGTKFEFAELIPNFQLKVDRWTNATTFNATQFNAGSTVFLQNITWFQLGDDGTNITFSASTDGVSYLQFYSEARTTYLSSPSQIGFFANAGGSTYNAYPTLMSYS